MKKEFLILFSPRDIQDEEIVKISKTLVIPTFFIIEKEQSYEGKIFYTEQLIKLESFRTKEEALNVINTFNLWLIDEYKEKIQFEKWVKEEGINVIFDPEDEAYGENEVVYLITWDIDGCWIVMVMNGKAMSVHKQWDKIDVYKNLPILDSELRLAYKLKER